MSTDIIHDTQIIDHLEEAIETEVMGLEPEDKKRKLGANIWHFFSKNDDGSGKCNDCGRSVKFSGNTTNGRSHLKNNHDKLFLDYQAMEGKKTVGLAKYYGSLGSNISDSAFRKLLSRFVVNADVPLNIVHQPDFVALLKRVNPTVNIPSRRTLSECIKREYRLKSVALKTILDSVDRLCITTDGWTSPQGTPFSTFTAHWLDDEWKAAAVCLGFTYTPPPHTAEVLYDGFIHVVKEQWGVLDKVGYITLDNASANSAFISLLKEEDIPDVVHVRCVGHVLNIVVQAILDDAYFGGSNHVLEYVVGCGAGGR